MGSFPALRRPVPHRGLGRSRTYTIAATFRDANGAVIKSVHSGYGYTNAKDVTRYQNTLTSLVNTATPIAQQPPFVRTALAATQKAFPVTGSVLIEGGRSAAGGTAGSQISLKVQLAASSPAGKVTEMRVQTTGGCNQPTLTAAWEPFTPKRPSPQPWRSTGWAFTSRPNSATITAISRRSIAMTSRWRACPRAPVVF